MRMDMCMEIYIGVWTCESGRVYQGALEHDNGLLNEHVPAIVNMHVHHHVHLRAHAQRHVRVASCAYIAQTYILKSSRPFQCRHV